MHSCKEVAVKPPYGTLFQSASARLLELLECDLDEAIGYQFASVDLKQKAFRLNGMFRRGVEGPIEAQLIPEAISSKALQHKVLDEIICTR